MNSPPSVTAINQALLQIVPGVVTTNPSASTPATLAALVAGTLITGNVYGRDASGTTQLETDAGMISLKMDIFIKRGVEVVLKMEQVQKDMFARIVSVDGKSLAKYMESVGGLMPEQDLIAHSSAILQTAVTPAETAENTVAAKDASTLLKAILVSPPVVDETATAALPPEVKLALASAQVGALLKIIVTDLELPLQIQNATALPPEPGTAPTAAPLPLPSPLIPGQPLPLNVAPGAPVPEIPIGNVIPTQPSPSQTVPTSIVPSQSPLVQPLAAEVAVVLETGDATQPLVVAPAPHISTTETATTHVPASFPEVLAASVLPAVEEALIPQTAAAPPTVPNIVSTATAPGAALAGYEELTPFLQNSTLSQILNAAPGIEPTTPAPPPVPTPVSVGFVTLLQENAASETHFPLPQTPALPGAFTAPAPYAIAPKPEFPLAVTPTAPPVIPTVPNAPAMGAAVVPPVTIGANGQPVFTATVIASSSDSQVTLQTPLGTIKLFSPTQLPPGTMLQFTLSGVDPAETGSDSIPGAGAVDRSFKGLDDITDLSYPTVAGAGGTPKLVPRPGPALSAEIFFLISALKGGDIRKWVGENNLKDMEKMGKLDLLQRIGQDFTTLRAAMAEAPAPQGWSQMTIPFFYEGMHQLNWFQKRGQKQEADKGKPSFDEHFLVDFHLTRLGHMQLDGLVKREKVGYSFDLTIRSEANLNPGMQQHIKDIYAEAQSIGGFKGMLVFRAGLDACVPLETLRAPHSESALHSIMA